MPRNRANGNEFSSGELFCGAGGLSRGFHSSGFRPLFANDLWPVALHSFLMNFDTAYRTARRGRSAAEGGNILALPGSIEALKPDSVVAALAVRQPGTNVGPGDLDVLLGGPPCQGYSINSHIRCAEDPRNHLFRHYIRILRGLAPKAFVLENVPGMLSLDGGRFFNELVVALGSRTSRSPGYVVNFKILNAAHYGVPQERFRIVVVGTRRDVAAIAGHIEIPTPLHYSLAQAHFKGGRTHTFHYAIGHRQTAQNGLLEFDNCRLLPPVTVREAIGDLPPLTNGGGIDEGPYDDCQLSSSSISDFQRSMRVGSRRLMNHWCRELLSPNMERVQHIPAGGDWRNIPRKLLPPGMKRALRKDHTTRYGRLDPERLAGTLLTKPDPHWGTFLHYDVAQQRLISVREAARFQSFPDTHVFYGSQVDQYRLCGNAVPPLMAAAIASQVNMTLRRFYHEHGATTPVAAGAFA